MNEQPIVADAHPPVNHFRKRLQPLHTPSTFRFDLSLNVLK
jgi:hypothetical protein